MASALYFWHGFIHRGTALMYLHYNLLPYLSPLPNICKASYTIGASIFVYVPYWLPYSSDKFFSCIVPHLSQWFLHFGEEIIIAWTHIGCVRWVFQKLQLPVAQEVRDNSGMTPCIVMKNDGVLYNQMSFSPESMRLWSLHQSERTTERDPVQHKTWTYPCYRVINTEHQKEMDTPSKHLAKGDE